MIFNHHNLMSLSIPVLKNVLKKFQKLNLGKFDSIDFYARDKVDFENFKELFLILGTRVNEPTAQKMFNNAEICSILCHLKTGETLLETILKSDGQLKVYLSSYK